MNPYQYMLPERDSYYCARAGRKNRVRLETRNALRIKYSVPGVQGSLVLRGIANQPLLLGEGNEGWGNTISLLVGN